MRTFAIFLAGLLTGVMLLSPRTALSEGGVSLNHVGIAVKDFDASINFYTRTMGFKQAFVLKNPDGSPALAYLQINRNTFLEVAPASATVPVGFTHMGMEAGDIKSTVTSLQQKGVSVKEATPSQRTGAMLTNMNDPDGIRTELLEYGPTSLQRKAMESWK